MTETEARLAGFTCPILAAPIATMRRLIIAYDADIDGHFAAYDRCTGEIVQIDGSDYLTEPDG